MRRERSPILEVCVRLELHTVLLFSLFLLFAGHNAPGGGFVGGLVAGAALVLVYAAGGDDGLARLVPVAPEALLGSGLVVAILSGVVPLLVGDQLLESTKLSTDVPVLGHVEASSVLVFDVGVYLVVVGLVLVLLRAMGRGWSA